MIRILWLAPNFNHYKARFLNHLAHDADIQLHILAGSGRNKMGDQEIDKDWLFDYDRLDVPKSKVGLSKKVRSFLKMKAHKFDWIMIPAEKKNFILFMYALKLKKQNKAVRLFSYNHPIFKSGKGKTTRIDKWLTKWIYKKMDRIIFYTEHSCKWAVEKKLINPEKAFWANNTIDNFEIEKYYTYQLPPKNQKTILFIGRLIPSKRIPDLIKYYSQLKKSLPDLRLEIIGDGPENHFIKSAQKSDLSINWHGTLIDEAAIAPIMKRASLVFIPGHSGLSVNHAFSYGRPYITLQGPSHAPELEYLDEGENGYILDGDFESNCNKLNMLLSNRIELERFCNKAKEKGGYLSVQKWVAQMKNNLLDE